MALIHPTMKQLVLIATISLLLLSCEKDDLVPLEELPYWLIARIEYDEQIIEGSPRNYLASGAWVRYEWNTEHYFEYWNLLSSAFPPIITFSGDTLDIYANDSDSAYYQEKGCKKYVWKGPLFKDWMFKD